MMEVRGGEAGEKKRNGEEKEAGEELSLQVEY